jgi:hypothetical protein
LVLRLQAILRGDRRLPGRASVDGSTVISLGKVRIREERKDYDETIAVLGIPGGARPFAAIEPNLRRR